MKMTSATVRRNVEEFQVGGYKFESVQRFTYLGVQLNVSNNLSDEIRRSLALCMARDLRVPE